MNTPRATVRLSFHHDFPFDAAVALIDYFAALGISHVVASPILARRADLAGGVTDHARVDPALGGEAGLRRLVATLRRRQMGLLVDITPATMAVGGTDNAVWLDILEWGRDSAHVSWLDADWRGIDTSLRNKLVVPFLDTSYGAALAAGTLRLDFDAAHGTFAVRHRDHVFPICPRDYPQILEAADRPEAQRLGGVFARLPPAPPAAADLAAARAHLAAIADMPEGRDGIAAACAAFDPRHPEGRARLHRLLERQAYRLAWWGTAADVLNWRRHPGSPALALLRQDRANVFDATHATLTTLFGEGLLDGFIIQQWDLLADPAGYARRLRLKLDHAALRRPPEAPQPAYLAADAVLAPDAFPPPGWGIAGTTGAEVQDTLGAALHDSAGSTALTDLWISTTGDRQRYPIQQSAIRRQTIHAEFGADLDAVARALHDVAQADLDTRDITFNALKRVIVEIVAAFVVRRTHADMDGFSPADAQAFAAAQERARQRLSFRDAQVVDLLAQWLGGTAPRQSPDFALSGARARAIAVFQQFTAMVARAAVDDTLLYRYGRLISRNEVGSDPASIALAASGFHDRMVARAAHCPHALTATAGPHQKRGEDARARLAVLSEAPLLWDDLLRQLIATTASFRTRGIDGVAPEPTDVVILFQTLVGVWPATLLADDALGLGTLNERLRNWWLKAIRCARLRTGPVIGDPHYEQGCIRFLSTLLEDPAGEPTRRLIVDFIDRIGCTATINSLSHLVLKCTVPGIPELFQGGEFWDLSLEDGDAAPVVDYLARGSSLDVGIGPERLLHTFLDGRVKQATLARLLKLRSQLPTFFRDGDYRPLTVDGPHAAHVLAFARRHRQAEMVTVVTRGAFSLMDPETRLPRVPPERWNDTIVHLPENCADGFRDAITGRRLPGGGRLSLSDVLAVFPAAVLVGM